MNEAQCEISTLLQAMTLRELRAIEAGSADEILRRIDRLTQLVLTGHRTEMHAIDVTTNELARQLEEIATGGIDAEEQARRLRAHVATLKTLGKQDHPIS